jgi:apolipoprotein N-acyltransferase
METPPPPTPSPSRIGRILLVNLGIMVVLHIGRQLLDSSEGIFVLLFIMAFINGLLFLLALFDSNKKNSLGFLLAAVLIFLIGFGDCATHLKLGSMH